MRNGWTGGQYSLFRCLFGLYLAQTFLGLAASSARPTGLAAIGAAASLLLVAGWQDRLVAAALLGLGAVLALAEPDRLVATYAGLGWLLLMHVLLPRAPYGSVEARGRSDPGAGWRMPGWILGPTWVPLAAGVGWTLGHWAGLPATLAVLPLALFARVRPWLWSAFALALGVRVVLAGAESGALHVAPLLLFVFDPGWIRPRMPRTREVLFYDGSCGLCHRAVRFLLAEDAAGQRFGFAPLDGATFRARVPERRRQGLPDSLVLLTEESDLLTRSAGVLRILARLGGLWRLLGALARLVPAAARDAAYDLVARVRHRLFARPEQACPIAADHLQARFLP